VQEKLLAPIKIDLEVVSGPLVALAISHLGNQSQTDIPSVSNASLQDFTVGLRDGGDNPIAASALAANATDSISVSGSEGIHSSSNSPSTTARMNKPRASAKGNGKGEVMKSQDNAQKIKEKTEERNDTRGKGKRKGKLGRNQVPKGSSVVSESEGKGLKTCAVEPSQEGKIHIPPHQKNVPRRTDFIAKAGKKWHSPVTTIMLRNIPNRYTNGQLIVELNEEGFAGTYNFLYVPIDFRNNCNVGYAFVNFLTEDWCQSFSEHMEGYRFQRFNSAKRACCVPAYVQGLEANVEHYRSTLVGSDEPLHRPVVFHNGQQITVRQAEFLFSQASGDFWDD
jgi:hypothetical protein